MNLLRPVAVPSLRADLALAGITFIWGSTFVVVKQALGDVSPMLFLALRFLVAAVALMFFFRRRWSGGNQLRTSVRAGAIAGLFLFAGFALQTVGLKYTTAPKSAFLTGLSIVLVPFAGAIVYRTRLLAREIGGSLVAMAGMGLMTLEGVGLRLGRGDLLTLGCAVAFAGHILVLGHYAPRVGFEIVSIVQVTVSALLAGSLFWWAETAFIRWSWGIVIALAITGLLATALAFAVQSWAQQYTTPAHTALIFALEPLFAWIASFLISGDTLSGQAAAGAALILSGVLIVELKPKAPIRHLSD